MIHAIRASFLLAAFLIFAACDVGFEESGSPPNEVELAVLILPADKGYVEVDGAKIAPDATIQVKKGKVLTLAAKPIDQGWRFARWERDLAGTAPGEALVMDGSKVVRAVFEQVELQASTPLPRTPLPTSAPTPSPTSALGPTVTPIVVVKEVIVEVPKEVVVIKEVPVEVIVEKEVIKEVIREVVVAATPMPTPTTVAAPKATPTTAPAPTPVRVPAATVAPTATTTPTSTPTPSVKPSPIHPPSGLVAWWPGDGNANDIVGGNHGTLVGGTTFAPGMVGQAFSLQTTSDAITFPHSTLNGLDDLTFGAWIKTTDTNAAILSGANAAVVGELQVAIPGTGQVSLHVKGPPGLGVSTPGISDGTLHHLTWVRRAGANEIYVDGVSKGTVFFPTGPLVIDPDGLWLGQEFDCFAGCFTPDQSFIGIIDEIVIFNRALSADEIKAIFDAGSAGLIEPVSMTAPDISITLFQGEEALGVGTTTIRLSDLRGKPLVLNFWAGLAPPSRREMPEIQTFYDEFPSRADVLGIDVGPFTGLGSNQDALNLLRELGITYPAGSTSDQGILEKFQIQAITTTVFVTADGMIFRRWSGPISKNKLAEITEEMLALTTPGVSPGLVAYWPFDGNSNDAQGRNHGALQGELAQFVSGRVGEGIKSPDVLINDAPDLDVTEFTASAWVRLDGIEFGNMSIIWKGDDAGTNVSSPYSIFVSGLVQEDPACHCVSPDGVTSGTWPPIRGQLAAMVSDGEKEHIVISDTVLPVGVFTHIAVTVDGSKIRIIINGQLDFEAQQEVSVAEGDFPLAIGRLNRFNFFNGVIDEVRIYNRALSTNEIKAIYDAGSAGMIMSKTIFADEVFLINDPNNTPDEGPPSSMFGPPDGRYVDMDGGGTTFGFPDEAVDFDWGVVIPAGTQLIVVTLDGANNVFGEVTWGYGTPIDNGDGIASNATGTTKLLETTTISPHPWSGEFPAKFLFYAFDGDFDGVSKEFFVSLDDLADTEIDAVAIYDAGSAGMINP